MTKRFLLIDDDRDDRELFVEALAEINSTIICDLSEGCKDAIDRLESGMLAKPNIIFLDVNMPIKNGWECLLQLKSKDHFKDIPVIMYSTSSRTRDFEIAMESGASSFFTKPNDYRELTNFLTGIIAKLENNTPIVYG